MKRIRKGKADRPAHVSRKTVFAVCGFALFFCGTSMAEARSALMPLPERMEMGRETVRIDGGLQPRWSNCGNTPHSAFKRLERDLELQTGIEFAQQNSMPLEIACGSVEAAADKGEGYRLTVQRDRIAIDADGPAGVLRALATMRQLVGLDTQGMALPLGRIDDKPRFAWRGVMLDTARHFLSVDTIKRQIDAMERVKLNVLHLHLSDDEGFRVQSFKYPKLTPPGGDWYTQDDIRELVKYAAERGVRIVPEFDVPGHTTAIADAYPEIGVKAPAFIPWLKASVLNPGNEQTYRFLDRLFGEMAGLFPDRYFHVGGDEVLAGVWDKTPDVAALKQKENLAHTHDVENHFHKRVQQILRKHGKTMIGWDEIARDGGPEGVVVQAWQTSNATAHAVAKGHPTIVSTGYYLDLLESAEFHYGKDPLSTTANGLTVQQAEDLRARNPLMKLVITDAKIAHPLPPLTPEQANLVLGGEAPLWAEIVKDELVDERLWPRAAALAERFWSPATVTDPQDMYDRLAVVSDQLTVSGLQDRAHETRQMLRLSPGDAAAVNTLLAVTGPVRNMAHYQRVKAMVSGKTPQVQHLNELADAAPIDSLVARRFAGKVRAFLKGEQSLSAEIGAQLTIWKANDPLFRAAAKGRPALEAALPTSARVAALADVGLAALEALGSREALAPDVKAKALQLLTQTEAEEAASAGIGSAFGQQPPADLIVKIAPGIRALVEAAGP